MVTIGTSALPSTCLTCRRRAGTPLALAVRMKSRDLTSRTAVRVVRMIGAAIPKPSTSEGMSSCWRFSTGSSTKKA